VDEATATVSQRLLVHHARQQLAVVDDHLQTRPRSRQR
jgi:hypothetical protein